MYPNPISYADIVTTTTHKTLAGPRGGLILAKGNNKKLYKKIDKSIFPQTQGGPLLHIIAAKAIAFKEALTKKFKKYQKQILKNSRYMAKEFLKNNFKLISNGTKNHLFLINLNNKNISGLKAEKILENINIIVNKNCIPNDTKKPSITSGIRIGTPAITRRGIKKKESILIAKIICKILINYKQKNLIKFYKKKIKKICNKFPIYKKKKT